MVKTSTATCLPPFPNLETAWQNLDSSFEQFSLKAGIDAIGKIFAGTPSGLPARRYSRGVGRLDHC